MSAKHDTLIFGEQAGKKVPGGQFNSDDLIRLTQNLNLDHDTTSEESDDNDVASAEEIKKEFRPEKSTQRRCVLLVTGLQQRLTRSRYGIISEAI